MIWEPFILALALGMIVSTGLYFAYLWPSIEPPSAADDGAIGAGGAHPVVTARRPAASPAAGFDGDVPRAGEAADRAGAADDASSLS